MSWLEPYEKGQEIIFQSEEGLQDTILIIEKTTTHDPRLITDKYSHASAKIVYYNRKFPEYMKSQEMIEMYKFYPNERGEFFFNFLNRGVQVNNYSNIPTEKILFKGNKRRVYRFDTYHRKAEGEKFRPKTVFWKKSKGVIRYITHDNVVWNLKEVKEANPDDWEVEF